MAFDRRAFRLLPSEEVLWHGRRKAGVPYDRRWLFPPVLAFAMAVVCALFAGLLVMQEMEGVRQTTFLATCFAAAGVVALLAPHYLVDGCEYLVTDRRIIWRRGRLLRTMERAGVTFGRIRWHRSASGVGSLELVRAVPFGPLARRQRIVLSDITEPDAVFALIRGAELAGSAGDADLPLAERLDRDEVVLWGGHPEGLLLGWREIGIATTGAGVTILGMQYGYRVAKILFDLEELGLQVRTWEWGLLFSAVMITWVVLLAVGVGLLWYGLGRARALGRETEYLLTDRRLLIRRGRIELSVDRRRIVDVADRTSARGLHHLFLVLDAPESRALADSGALRMLLPSRESVPPVLYELRDAEAIRDLILQRDSQNPGSAG